MAQLTSAVRRVDGLAAVPRLARGRRSRRAGCHAPLRDRDAASTTPSTPAAQTNAEARCAADLT
eukprot:1181357-Prymnesium_polylepis.1